MLVHNQAQHVQVVLVNLLFKDSMISKLKNWWLNLMPHIGLAPIPEPSKDISLFLITTSYGYALRKTGAGRSIKLFTDYNEAYKFSKAYSTKHKLKLHLKDLNGKVTNV